MSGKQKNHIPVTQQTPAPVIPAGKKDLMQVLLKRAPAAILLFTALVYLPAIFNGFTSFDDDAYILNNPLLKDCSLQGITDIFTSFSVGNYHPFTLLVYLLEYTCFGHDPVPYHLTNVLLHLVNTLLVFRLAERLSGKRVTAIVVALLFAIHPMHVESVAWASELKDVLYAVFYLSALLYYMRYLASGFRTKFYIGTLLFFLASLFSKSAAVTLPVLLVAIDLYKGRRVNAKSLTEKIPFLLLSVLFGIINIVSQHADKAFTNLSATYNPFNRIVLVASSVAFYIIKAIAPFSLSAMHFFPRLHNNMLPGQYYTSLAFLLFVGILLAVAWCSPWRKDVLFGSVFFLITISVMLQIVAVGSMLTAERYTYLPYLGLFYILGQWVSTIDFDKHRKLITGIGALVVIILSAQTWARIGVWKNDATLYTDIREKEPKTSKDMAHGFSLRADKEKTTGDFKSALGDYNQALLLDTGSYEALCNRGYAHRMTGDLPAAFDDFNNAISMHPEFADAYNNRGGIYYAQNNIQAAIRDFSKAIEIKPFYVEAYTNRGWAYFGLNDVTSALNDYNKAISINPANAQPYISRGWIYFNMQDSKSAMQDYDKAIALNPRLPEAYSNRGMIYFRQGDFPSAEDEYTKAIALDPGFVSAYDSRGWAYVQDNNPDAALSDYTKALTLNPQDALAYHNRASIKANSGDLTGALKDYDGFLQLQPQDNAGYYERGLVRYNLKDTPGACSDWKMAAQLGNEEAAKAVQQFCH
jgi:tetratricopeptide (TPR) repeat protein